VGIGTCDRVLHIRASGQELTRERRSVAAANGPLLPIPVDSPGAGPSKAEARRRLGIAEDVKLIVSVASGFKYGCWAGTCWLDAVLPVAMDRRDVQVLVVGPKATGEWSHAEKLTDGRIRALGVQSNVDLLYRAADVYLDSFPMGSATSNLEAMAHGLPVLSLVPDAVSARTLFADHPSVPDRLFHVPSAETLKKQLCQLLDDAELRAITGSDLASRVNALHSGDGWRASLEQVYADVTENDRNLPDAHSSEHRVEELDLLIEDMNRRRGSVTDVGALVERNLRMLPALSRWTEWARLVSSGRRTSPLLLFSEPTTAKLGGVRRILRTGARLPCRQSDV
jgi:Glycosyl transferases group 1